MVDADEQDDIKLVFDDSPAPPTEAAHPPLEEGLAE